LAYDPGGFPPGRHAMQPSYIANIFVITYIVDIVKSFPTNSFVCATVSPLLFRGGLMSTVGERIREVREARGWTQEKLAGAARISKSFLSEVENKGKNISLDLLLRVATALDASIEYLATGGGDEAKSRKSIVIPPELSQAAEQLELSFQQAIDLLDAYNSIVARRSSRLRANPSVGDWEKLHHELQQLRKNYG
jgi:transcriptional regulator with XRE-family HTH domain